MCRLLRILAIIPVFLCAAAGQAALDCSGTIEATLDEQYVGDTTGAPNTVTYYGCSDWEESGGEAIYHIVLAAPTMFTVRLESVCDLDLAILTDCDEILGCVEVTDDGATTTSPLQGDFYFVVDGYEGAACAFTLYIDDTGIPVESMTFGGIKTLFAR